MNTSQKAYTSGFLALTTLGASATLITGSQAPIWICASLALAVALTNIGKTARNDSAGLN